MQELVTFMVENAGGNQAIGGGLTAALSAFCNSLAGPAEYDCPQVVAKNGHAAITAFNCRQYAALFAAPLGETTIFSDDSAWVASPVSPIASAVKLFNYSFG